MPKSIVDYCLCLVFFAALSTTSLVATPAIEWGELPPLPTIGEEAEALGVAGPFVGVHNGALLVAGGANFRRGCPGSQSQMVRRHQRSITIESTS